MNAPEAAAKEAERALKNGAHAVQLGTNVNGKPIDGKEFWPLYEVIEKSGKPILLHPARSREMIDYQGEDKSKYEICSRARLAVRDRRRRCRASSSPRSWTPIRS